MAGAGVRLVRRDGAAGAARALRDGRARWRGGWCSRRSTWSIRTGSSPRSISDRAARGAPLDVAYAATLSADALPAFHRRLPRLGDQRGLRRRRSRSKAAGAEELAARRALDHRAGARAPRGADRVAGRDLEARSTRRELRSARSTQRRAQSRRAAHPAPRAPRPRPAGTPPAASPVPPEASSGPGTSGRGAPPRRVRAPARGPRRRPARCGRRWRR